MKIFIIIIWITYSCLDGLRDAHFFHNRNTSTDPDKQNIHWLFSIQRSIVIILMSWIYSKTYSALDTGIFSFSMILLFSFLHNGMYYRTRNFLDKNLYPKKWWDSSTTSESILELSVVSRTFLAFVGIMGIITSLTF